MKVINKSMELISSGIYKIKDELYGECSVEKIIYEIINTEIFKTSNIFFIKFNL